MQELNFIAKFMECPQDGLSLWHGHGKMLQNSLKAKGELLQVRGFQDRRTRLETGPDKLKR